MTEFFNVDTTPNASVYAPVNYPNDATPRQTYNWLRVLAGEDSVFSGNVYCKGELRDKNNAEVLGGLPTPIYSGTAVSVADSQTATFNVPMNSSPTIVGPAWFDNPMTQFNKLLGATTEPNFTGVQLGEVNIPENCVVRGKVTFDITNYTTGSAVLRLDNALNFRGDKDEMLITGNGIYEGRFEAFPVTPGAGSSGVLSMVLDHTGNGLTARVVSYSMVVESLA